MPVDDAAVQLVGVPQGIGSPFRQQCVPCEALQQARIVGPLGEVGVVVRPPQHAILDQKLDVDQAAPAMFDMELIRIAAVQAVAHLLPHAVDVVEQPDRVTRLTQDRTPDLAESLSEEIRSGIAAEPVILPGGPSVPVSVSIGVAALGDDVRQPPDAAGRALLDAADRAVYIAKQAGRNRVACERRTGG